MFWLAQGGGTEGPGGPQVALKIGLRACSGDEGGHVNLALDAR